MDAEYLDQYINVDGQHIFYQQVLVVGPTSTTTPRTVPLLYLESEDKLREVVVLWSHHLLTDKLRHSLRNINGLLYHVHLIVNNTSGFQKASQFAENILVPVLSKLDISHDYVDGAAKDTLSLHLSNIYAAESKPTFAVVGGDGTVGTLLNALDREANLLIFPFGTANAMYHHLFHGSRTGIPVIDDLLPLKQALLASPIQTHLTQMSTHFVDENNAKQTAHTLVVTSFALHATILRESEKLREQIPGPSRFAKAARDNITTWYDGTLTIDHPLQVWDPQSASFKDHHKPVQTVIEGPFFYLALSLVRGFEEKFIVAPARLPLSDGMDILLIRPTEIPWIALVNKFLGSSVAGALFAYFYLPSIFRAFYNGGTQVDMLSWLGRPLVEYYRARKLSYVPRSTSSICLDGLVAECKEATIQCMPSPFSAWV